MAGRPVVRLRVGGARGHLFFFRKMVVRPEPPVDPGSLVDVVDREGVHVGRAFYNPRSNIALRLLAVEPDGRTDEEFLRDRLRQAVKFRHEGLDLPASTDAYRVCHSEGDGLSGLVVDRFGPVLSLELFSRGFFKLLEPVKAWLGELFPGTRFAVRSDALTQDLEGFRLPSQPPAGPVTVKENGVEFLVDPDQGHKTGFFCDQRENRKALAGFARGRVMLDLCTYTGGFAIPASMAGAARVTAIDMDEDALETARRNARRNRQKIDFLHADLFNYLRQTKETFDLIVLDPPKLARDPEDMAKARRTYHDMNAMALKAARPGAIFLTCSCSGRVAEEEFLRIVRQAAVTAGKTLQIFRVGGAGPDHPVSSLYPEGRYLKAVYAKVMET